MTKDLKLLFFLMDNNIASSIMWKSKKLPRVAKSDAAAETLIQVENAEACFQLASLLNEMLQSKPNDKGKNKLSATLTIISYTILVTQLDLYKGSIYKQKNRNIFIKRNAQNAQ